MKIFKLFDLYIIGNKKPIFANGEIDYVKNVYSLSLTFIVWSSSTYISGQFLHKFK
jgi:hypothetical protein